MKVLMVGDVVGRPGRRAVSALLPRMKRDLDTDVVIVNGENAASGRGLTMATADELFEAGVDVITSGNHIWDLKEIIPFLDGEAPIIRPYNYPPGTPGTGIIEVNGVTVLNLQGRAFMPSLDCPFRAADAALSSVKAGSIIVVDMHGEATSEKVAMGWYLDGRVAAVLGTHTHVGTIDTRILPRGTAFVCDVGMVGARDSIIGDDIEAVISRFLTQLPTRLPVADDHAGIMFNSVLVEIDEVSGGARRIARVDRELEKYE